MELALDNYICTWNLPDLTLTQQLHARQALYGPQHAYITITFLHSLLPALVRGAYSAFVCRRLSYSNAPSFSGYWEPWVGPTVWVEVESNTGGCAGIWPVKGFPEQYISQYTSMPFPYLRTFLTETYDFPQNSSQTMIFCTIYHTIYHSYNVQCCHDQIEKAVTAPASQQRAHVTTKG